MTLTYRDVMLDWAVAELMSPHWHNMPSSVWARPSWEAWRDHVRRSGAFAWTEVQASALIQTLVSFRQPILSRYGPAPDWQFGRRTVDHSELGGLYVMSEMFPPGGRLAELAQWVCSGAPDYVEMASSVSEISDAMRSQSHPYGALVAVHTASSQMVLIEGYKRAMARLALKVGSTPLIVASAPCPIGPSV